MPGRVKEEQLRLMLSVCEQFDTLASAWQQRKKGLDHHTAKRLLREAVIFVLAEAEPEVAGNPEPDEIDEEPMAMLPKRRRGRPPKVRVIAPRPPAMI